MAQFITRVELHGARTKEDYDRLHTLMGAAGFSRVILGDDGRWYKLPTAMYVSRGDLTTIAVRDLARNAAARTGHYCWVVTARAEDIAWDTELVPVTNYLAALGMGIVATPIEPPPPSPLATLLALSAWR